MSLDDNMSSPRSGSTSKFLMAHIQYIFRESNSISNKVASLENLPLVSIVAQRWSEYGQAVLTTSKLFPRHTKRIKLHFHFKEKEKN